MELKEKLTAPAKNPVLSHALPIRRWLSPALSSVPVSGPTAAGLPSIFGTEFLLCWDCPKPSHLPLSGQGRNITGVVFILSPMGRSGEGNGSLFRSHKYVIIMNYCTYHPLASSAVQALK
jgi:hypothetical protein